MKLFKTLSKKKLLLLNLFLFIYVATNLIGGERGLHSYFEKRNLEKNLLSNKNYLDLELTRFENKNYLLSKKIDLDYLDILYRDKLKLVKECDILIQLNNEN